MEFRFGRARNVQNDGVPANRFWALAIQNGCVETVDLASIEILGLLLKSRTEVLNTLTGHKRTPKDLFIFTISRSSHFSHTIEL